MKGGAAVAPEHRKVTVVALLVGEVPAQLAVDGGREGVRPGLQERLGHEGVGEVHGVVHGGPPALVARLQVRPAREEVLDNVPVAEVDG
eukprot:CAMPEP_0113712854 /NCGR_PEP_ID=MMETSP0038_2-20120614/31634_1 /TAXON_ID=2898 /ORGANISM="Cryptomonas paramecium" /LENGTH=88 /DNA_ID=CAMNT_0000639449 /DNA_START=226 /DNA_END=487 /DNA_ORIENTATION=- /assembly_acc=CAM_ASM_000170